MLSLIYIGKIIVNVSCGTLNAWGGYSWHNARRFIMPIVIGVTVSFVSNIWWLGLCCLPTMGTLCMGYPKYGNFGRSIWLIIQAIMLGIGLVILHHLNLWIFLPYVIGAGILGGIYKNWWQPLGDFIVGCYLGSIIFFVY